MDRQDIVKRLLYPKCKTAIEFKFDNLRVNPLLSYITVQDIMQLNKIATSIKYSSKPKEKYAMIDNIMTARGFRKMASGTNRVTYRCLNDYAVVIKIAIDKVGLSDNGNEFRNQHLLKPFVTKCFEVSPCGTVGLFERVVPITSREEFIHISDDVFDLINNLIGKYVLEDIGEKYYMNYGLREGFGPVLLDYPYVFELDGRKLICNVPEPMEPKGYCGGEIDYDLGYNDLRCKKCGKRYLATDLKSDVKSEQPKIIIEGEDTMVKCILKRGDEIVSTLNSEAPASTSTIKSKDDFLKYRARETKGKKSYNRKPEIKTSDDVHVKVRIRGLHKRDIVDIDELARKEAEENTIKIPISFAEKPVNEVVEDVVTTPATDTVVPVEEVVEETPENISNDTFVDDGEDKYTTTVIIKYGLIYDAVTGDLIGYTYENESECEDDYGEDPAEYDNVSSETTDRFVTDETAESTEETADAEEDEYEEDGEESEVVYSDPEDSGNTIGSLIDKLPVCCDNDGPGYKTSEIKSNVDSHFAVSSKKNVEVSTEVKEKINNYF